MATATAVRTRFRAVDVFRGGVLVFLAVLVFTPTTGWRGHAEWWGWRPSDVFFPAFLLTAGAGLALQSRNGLPWPRLLRRFVSLIVLGLLLNAFLLEGADLTTLRYPGVLQRIAIVGLAGALVVAAGRRRWWVATLAALVLCIGWGAMVAHAGSDCVSGEPTRDPPCGTFVEVDERLFGTDHIYAGGIAGHDPEGMASTLGALASFLAGFGAGRLLVDRRAASQRSRFVALLALAAGWLAVTPVLSVFAPFGKRLWTPTFVSLNAAAGIAAVAVLLVVLDSAWRQRAAQRAAAIVAWPFEAVGRNALVLWLGLTLTDAVLLHTPGDGADAGGATTLGDQLLDSWGATTFFLVLFTAWLAVASAMHATKWHVRL